MSRFDQYFQMDVKDIIEYTLEKAKEIPWDIDSMQAIVPSSHGNLNYVYRVWDAKNHSIYIKQAGTEARISKDMKPSKDRNRLESEIIMLEDQFAPGMVPHIYFFDTVMCACGMEDCSEFTVMRDAMLQHKIYPHFAEDISSFMVNTLLLSSDVVMDHKEKKELVRKFISPDLCDITEKLVFMEPYNDLNHRNNVFAQNADFVKKELYSDSKLHLEVAKLKFKFMTDAQSLMHGDLHTGSIFIRENATKVFDSEFGTYAPMGYDVGNVVANLIFAYDSGLAADKIEFCDWVLQTIEKTIDLFIEKFNHLFDISVTEPMAKTEGFKEWYLEGILNDTAGYAGTELHRRTVGMANVADVVQIADVEKRLLAERINIFAGKDYILNQTKFRTGADFAAAVTRAREAAIKTI